MTIGNEITVVTQLYHSKKGNDYKLVRLDLIDIPEDMRDMYNPQMYGTINYEFLTNGKLNTPLNLAAMAIGKTVYEAIERREDVEAIEGMSMEEIVEYFRKKM